MSENILIRNETEKDYKEVENLIREAFYNLYVPGCAEHYLAHVIRGHEDFIRELDMVMEKEGRIIGSIMYTRTRLVDEEKNEKEILTFGPVCVLPEYQRKGYGKILMERSFEMAEEMGYEAIVIFGSPVNYVSRGFKSCKQYDVSLEDGSFPSAMMVKELKTGALKGRRWIYRQSPAFEIDEEEAKKFDDLLPAMKKKWQPSQEEFYIMSRSTL